MLAGERAHRHQGVDVTNQQRNRARDVILGDRELTRLHGHAVVCQFARAGIRKDRIDGIKTGSCPPGRAQAGIRCGDRVVVHDAPDRTRQGGSDVLAVDLAGVVDRNRQRGLGDGEGLRDHRRGSEVGIAVLVRGDGGTAGRDDVNVPHLCPAVDLVARRSGHVLPEEFHGIRVFVELCGDRCLRGGKRLALLIHSANAVVERGVIRQAAVGGLAF